MVTIFFIMLRNLINGIKENKGFIGKPSVTLCNAIYTILMLISIVGLIAVVPNYVECNPIVDNCQTCGEMLSGILLIVDFIILLLVLILIIGRPFQSLRKRYKKWETNADSDYEKNQKLNK